jgi:hypothetical protein
VSPKPGGGFAADRFWRESIGVRAHVFSLVSVAVVTWITPVRKNIKRNLPALWVDEANAPTG